MFSSECITNPTTLYSRSSVLSGPCPVPAERGVYGWFFKNTLPNVPLSECATKDGKTLFYVGISPSRPFTNQNLRKRITSHFKGNAEGSTLRLTLGVLLAEQSGFPLCTARNSKSKTFSTHGEQWLNDWMEENAFVCWVQHPEPWDVESGIIKSVSLPLNIQGNDHPFAETLSSMRKEAWHQARAINRGE